MTVLENAGIPYMVTGSLASSSQGEPRSTHDIDLLVQLGPKHVGSLMEAFPSPDFYLSESSIREAIRDQRMFNLLELATGDKMTSGWSQMMNSTRLGFVAGERTKLTGSQSMSVLRKTRS